MTPNRLNISHWTDLDNSQGVLFFGLLVDEMLFDYTLDSYKPSALNTKSLLLECLHTISEVRKGSIKEKNLQTVIEELKWSFKSDQAIKKILGDQFEYYLSEFKPNNVVLDELYSLCKLTLNSLTGVRYYQSLKEVLIAEIIGKKRKGKIRKITNSLITELINFGYHPNYIFSQNRYTFFSASNDKDISSDEDVNHFFKIFDFKETTFTVVFKGKFLFKSFRTSLNAFNIVVTANYRPFSRIQADLQFSRNRKYDESFVICSKISAFDHLGAREKAEGLVGRIANIFNFYHHKEKPTLTDKAIVCRDDDNFVKIINRPVRSILKVNGDMYPINAASAVRKTLELDLQRNTMYRFARALDLHSAALAAAAIENQLLDLWAALETLLPKKINSGKDRIVQLAEVLVDSIQLHYLEKLIKDLEKSLLKWDKDLAVKVLSELPNLEGSNTFERVAALVMIKSNSPQREKFYEALSTNPLLKNKLYEVFMDFNTPSVLMDRIQNHSKKLNWHLRRIYRTRGFIIHSGQIPSYSATLVENLHGYLDVFIKQFIEMVQKNGVKSIEEGILRVRMKVKYRNDLIKGTKEVFSIDSVRKIIRY